jgi:hypothetical protein
MLKKFGLHEGGRLVIAFAATIVMTFPITQVAAKPDRPVSADRLVTDINVEIETLLEAVRLSDKTEMARLAKSIEVGLDELERLISERPAYAFTVDGRTMKIATLGLDAQPVNIAKKLVKQPGIGIELGALRNKTVGSLDWLMDNNKSFALVYYSPASVFLATPEGFFQRVGSLLVDAMPLDRTESLSKRQDQLAIAWRAAHELSIPVRQDLAQRWDLSVPLMRMDYFDSGLVSPKDATYQDLLDEVTRQLAYIVNVKYEGPPLLRALRAGLFFNEEFGFMAWGGRWPAFDRKVFFLRYDPQRDSFLVRLDDVP